MPIHEFECSDCGYRFERLQKLSATDPVDCPHCGRPRLHRRISAPAFRLVGSGWYETDFKDKGEKKHNLASGDDVPKVEAKAAGAGDGAAAAPAASSGAKASDPPATPKPTAPEA